MNFTVRPLLCPKFNNITLMKIRFLFILVLISSIAFAQSKGTVSGTLTDKEANDATLPFANAVIKGTSIGVTTDENGKYSIAVIPGTYTIVFSFLGYENAEENFTVAAGETVTVNKALGSGAYTLKDVVIQASSGGREKETALLLDQKNAVEIKQSIGAQEMQRKGVSTVEQGVAKISGVSKVDDRGIFIRGLDDRYNYLQINGLNFIPSDPNLKTIPLSFIPTDVVRNIDVYKTFNASLYQDFAGASINIITKDISNKSYTKVSLSAGFNTLSTMKDFKTSNESDTGDFFGYTGNTREIPSVFDDSRSLSYKASAADSKNLFKSTWNPETTKAAPTIGTGITNSDSFELENDRKIGYIFNMNFGNNYLTQRGKRRNLNSEGTAAKDFELSSWKYLTQKSALASINYRKTDKYSLFFNVLYLQNSENTIEEIYGANDGYTETFFLRDTKYVENTSFGAQQYGTFYFKKKKHTLEYGLAATIGKNNAPDRKTLITDRQGADADFITINGVSPFRFYSVLDNFNANGKVDYEIKFGGENEAGNAKNTIKVGYNGDMTNYDFFQRTIRAVAGNLPDTTLDTNNPQAFFDTNFDNGSLHYESSADPTYKIEIKQFINAGFVNYTRYWNKLTLDLGVRLEYMLRETKYREEGKRVTDPLQKATYDPIDFNPVLNLKYLMTDKANLRFTASKTSTKPRFREILPFRYQDGDGNFTIGNANLKNTTNYNADLKYEVFPNSNAVFSAAVFGKYIQDPITRLVDATSTGFLTKYDNFDEATIYGLELEANFGLNLLFGDSYITDRTSLGLNTILMQSNEKADQSKFPQLTTTDRSLQGASDFIINADVSYQIIKSDQTESKVGLIFNTFTDRIYSVGNSGAADIVQKPIEMLDFTWRNTFSKKYQLNFSVKNILQSEILTTQDATKTIANPATYSNINKQLNQGTDFSLEFSYTF